LLNYTKAVTTEKLSQGKENRELKPTTILLKHSCRAPSAVMGRRRHANHAPQKNNSIQHSEGNEENGYPVPSPTKQ
jgi:hypothetical protein